MDRTHYLESKLWNMYQLEPFQLLSVHTKPVFTKHRYLSPNHNNTGMGAISTDHQLLQRHHQLLELQLQLHQELLQCHVQALMQPHPQCELDKLEHLKRDQSCPSCSRHQHSLLKVSCKLKLCFSTYISTPF